METSTLHTSHGHTTRVHSLHPLHSPSLSVELLLHFWLERLTAEDVARVVTLTPLIVDIVEQAKPHLLYPPQCALLPSFLTHTCQRITALQQQPHATPSRLWSTSPSFPHCLFVLLMARLVTRVEDEDSKQQEGGGRRDDGRESNTASSTTHVTAAYRQRVVDTWRETRPHTDLTMEEAERIDAALNVETKDNHMSTTATEAMEQQTINGSSEAPLHVM